jgi:hypothetical protein
MLEYEMLDCDELYAACSKRSLDIIEKEKVWEV